MPTINSPLAAGNTGVPIVRSDQLGQLSGAFLHFPDLTTFNAAVTNEQANVAAGSPLWADGMRFTIASEASTRVYRVWSVSGNHARTVVLSSSVSVILGSSTNTVILTSGIPASGTGNNGDLATDPGKAYYLKTSGTWAQLGTMATTFTGDVTGSGTGSIALSLTPTAVTAGVYSQGSLTVDANGRVTAATNGLLQVGAARPTASSANAGQFYRQFIGNIDTVYLCCQTGSTTYSWIPITPTVLPTLSAAFVNDATPNTVSLVFTAPMDITSTSAATAWVISGGTHTVTAAAWVNSSQLNLTLQTNQPVVLGEVLTLAYTTPALNKTRDYAGNNLANFTGSSIINNTAADTKPRYGTGSTAAYQPANVAALFAGMQDIPNSTNGSRVCGPFTVSPAPGIYGWVAIPQSAALAGATFTDGLGSGGWQGAGAAGNFTGVSPSTSTSTVTYVHSTGTYLLFRQDYSNSPFTGSIS